MLSVSVSAVRRSYLRISRARRRRTGSPPQGPPGTRSVGGLRTLRSFVEPASRIPAPLRQSSQAADALETTASAPFFDRDVSGMRGRKVQGTNTVSKLRRASLAFCLSAVREVRRLMQRSCGSARHLQSCGRTSLPHHFRHRSSKVEFNLAAIPPGPLGLPLVRQATKSLPGVQDTAVPAVGAASVSQLPRRGPQLPATPCAVPSASASLRPASIRLTVPVSVGGCTPLDRFPALTPLGRPGPGPGGRLPNPSAVGLCRGLGARGLPALAPPKPATPTAPDRLRGQRSTAFRALDGLETLARGSEPATVPASTAEHAPPSRPRDSKPSRPTKRPPPRRQC